MPPRFLIGYLVAALLSLQLSALVFFLLVNLTMTPNLWLWLLATPVLGYWVGQAPRKALTCGLVCGWITPPLLLWIPELPWLASRLLYPGGCGNSWFWARAEATGLLFCLPAALGQLRCYLRKVTQNRLPE